MAVSEQPLASHSGPSQEEIGGREGSFIEFVAPESRHCVQCAHHQLYWFQKAGTHWASPADPDCTAKMRTSVLLGITLLLVLCAIQVKRSRVVFS